jgi:hypothetical protein
MHDQQSNWRAYRVVVELGLLVFTFVTLGLLATDTVRPFPGEAGRIARGLDIFACALFFVDWPHAS